QRGDVHLMFFNQWEAKRGAGIGRQLQQVFGMAEGLVNYTRLDDSAEKIIHTQGYPMCPDDEVWVADAEGNPLPQGEGVRPARHQASNF
ncbi:hypothetical protein ACUOA9_38690, partial [Escherichia sp. HC-TM1]